MECNQENMKCPLCTPGRYPEWPALRQAGIQDWLKCPVCKVLFYGDGREIKEENHHPIQEAKEKDREAENSCGRKG